MESQSRSSSSTSAASAPGPASSSSASTTTGLPSLSLSPISDHYHLPDKPGADKGTRQLSIVSVPDHQRDRITVPSACVACRSKHLKCSGLSPCSRCSENDIECVYVRSRRGFKGPRRNQGAQNKASTVAVNAPKSCPLVRPDQSTTFSPKANIHSSLVTPPDQRLQVAPFNAASLPAFKDGLTLALDQTVDSSSGLDLRTRCVEAFFFHVYPAHPFLLPRESLLRLLKEKPLEHLEAAIRYIGSFFVTQAPTTAYCLEAERSIYRADCPSDGFKVQAMLILTIGLDGYTSQEKALQILTDAQELALELGMNNREFASMHGDGWPSLEESWRRTWWEMFVVDGMIAGVHQKSFFPMKDVTADVQLPCEEHEYMSGVSVLTPLQVTLLTILEHSTSSQLGRFRR